jgi:pimeloyl-ACP methyl ester carboxylesterase
MLVLLPGMNGTGELFAEFLSYYDGDHLVISLPESGPQDHATLASVINQQLPNESYILLAESFSGGIVPELLKLNPIHIKGVIFVASFLSSPRSYLIGLAKLLPIKALVSLPLTNIAHSLLFLGQEASKEILSKFVSAIESIPKQVLSSRLEVMKKQQIPQITFDIPAIYIRALSDRLISPKKSQEVANVFKQVEFVEIEGPHFILQAKPKETAELIQSLLQSGKL